MAAVKVVLLIMVTLLSFGVSPNLQAALFGEKEAVKTIKPDAALSLDGLLTLDFAWRNTLSFDAKKLNMIVTYVPMQPNAKGIKTITEEVSNGSGSTVSIPIPSFGKTKYTHPLDYKFSVLPQWISQSGKQIKIRLPERIKGVGDYQLAGLRFNCPAALCKGKKFDHTGLYDSDFMLSFGVTNKDNAQHTLILANDVFSSFTGHYNGVLRRLGESTGYYQGENTQDLANYNGVENGDFYNTLQDKNGKWHFSELAFRQRYEGSCASDYNGPSIHANNYATMQWAQAFPNATYGSVYDTYLFDKNSKRIQLSPSQWTGCVSFKAQNMQSGADGEEERQYSFENGKLYKRRIDRGVKGIYTYETIYLDSQQQLSTVTRTQFVDKTQKETKLQWRKIEHEAYPQSKPAPKVDLNALKLEAADVLKIISPEFAKK